MSVKTQFRAIALFFIALSMGCGSNVSVTGKVTLPDGTPLTKGEVIFQTETMVSRGDIQADGTYFMATGGKKGIPKGSYRVSIEGFSGPSMEMVAPAEGRSGPQMRPVFSESPIDSKYFIPETSGLTCEVKGNMTHNIELLPPGR